MRSIRGRSCAVLGRLAVPGIIVMSTLVAVLIAEVVARLAVEPADFLQVTLVEDPVLNHRIAPGTSGHDSLGFRNAEFPERSDIVAIGDSMTYGVGASREGSWPHQLGEILGVRVYNMGLGGYGPLQYLHLARTSARMLRPRLLVIGFYYGNDLMDALYVARGRPYWHQWRMVVDESPQLTPYDAAGKAEPTKRLQWLRDWLSRNSVLYSLLRVTVLPRFRAWEEDNLTQSVAPDVRVLWHDEANPAVGTIFTSRLRLAAVDLGLAPVNEGMQIAKKALSELKSEAEGQGVRLLVVLIPTKEHAYCSRVRAMANSMPDAYFRLC